GDDYRAAQIGKEPAERIGRADRDQRQRENEASEAEVIGKKPDVAPVQRRNNNKKYVDDGDHAGLCRREPAGENATQKNDRDHQRQRGVFESASNFAEWSAGTLYTDRTEEIAKDHQAEANHQARHDTSHEEPEIGRA